MERILKVDADNDFGAFCKECDLFCTTVKEACLSVINDWVERGLIDSEGVETLKEHLNENIIELLPDNF